MGAKSEIHWTDATWNPTTGCSHVSPGCEHCYAEALSHRFKRTTEPWTKPFEAENVKLHPDRLRLPLTWREPKKVFVDSMSDLFHERIPDSYIDKVFAVMSLCPQHTFQVLTKRPARMLQWFNERFQPDAATREQGIEDWEDRKDQVFEAAFEFADTKRPGHWTPDGNLVVWERGWPLPNVWIGVSVEDQRRADERIPLLVKTPAAVRFLSCEPLLGPVDLTKVRWRPLVHPESPSVSVIRDPEEWDDWKYFMSSDLGIHWVIAGGESGPHFRPMDLDWVRSLRDQCNQARVPYFYKQGSGLRPGRDRELDGRVWGRVPPGGGAMKRVLFLDIDGVLNSTMYSWRNGPPPQGAAFGIDPDAVMRLNLILDITRASVVLSSTWRQAGLIQVHADLVERGFRHALFSATQPEDGRPRWQEIGEWLIQHPDAWDRFAVVDDDRDAWSPFLEHPPVGRFCHVNPLHGLTNEHVAEIVNWFGG